MDVSTRSNHITAGGLNRSVTVDHELGCNIGIYAKVMAQRPCVDKNIADMERFRQDSAEVQRDHLLRQLDNRSMPASV